MYYVLLVDESGNKHRYFIRATHRAMAIRRAKAAFGRPVQSAESIDLEERPIRLLP